MSAAEGLRCLHHAGIHTSSSMLNLYRSRTDMKSKGKGLHWIHGGCMCVALEV